MQGNQLTSNLNPKRTHSRLSLALSLGLSITGLLLTPFAATAQSKELESEELKWARVDFLRNRVQLVPREQRSRRARISDVLSIGDALRTARASRAELRFNDGSLARIGERATFRFTPNTRNFQLSNGTVLLLIPPGRGRSTIQTPNAVTGIQGSALFVRYIPETDTTIVGALTDNPDGPMVLFNEDGTEQQALRSNEIGVITGDQITEIYQFDGALFWQSSGLAEGFDYLSPPSSSGDPLDGVRQEIREALSNQRPLDGDGVIENPDSFSRPAPPAVVPVEEDPPAIGEPVAESQEPTSESTDAVAADAPDTAPVDNGISGSASDAVGQDDPSTEASAASEDLDLEVTLDLELDLELEADGVEATELDINETAQQYLEGNATVNGASDFESENSLRPVNTDETGADSSDSPPADGASNAQEASDEISDTETDPASPDDTTLEDNVDSSNSGDSSTQDALPSNEPLPSDQVSDQPDQSGANDAATNLPADGSLPKTQSDANPSTPAVNVADVSPSAAEPPVEVFIPADQVDDLGPMNHMGDGMDDDDHMMDDDDNGT